MSDELKVVIGVFLAFVTISMGAQAILRRPVDQETMQYKAPAAAQLSPCVGTAISVPFSFRGGFEDPHSCKPQCADGKPRFILYSNGKATQCETPPGCNDWGEDNGTECRPPALSPAQ